MNQQCSCSKLKPEEKASHSTGLARFEAFKRKPSPCWSGSSPNPMHRQVLTVAFPLLHTYGSLRYNRVNQILLRWKWERSFQASGLWMLCPELWLLQVYMEDKEGGKQGSCLFSNKVGLGDLLRLSCNKLAWGEMRSYDQLVTGVRKSLSNMRHMNSLF